MSVEIISHKSAFSSKFDRDSPKLPWLNTGNQKRYFSEKRLSILLNFACLLYLKGGISYKQGEETDHVGVPSYELNNSSNEECNEE